MNTTLLFVSVFLSVNLFGQNVYIPDANFKAYLVGNPEINTNNDTEIQVSEANSYDYIIQCGSLGIQDLTGIEEFTEITTLSCPYNQISELDLSNNTGLFSLNCYHNNLTYLKVNLNIWSVMCYNNALTHLDLSDNINLKSLNCRDNELNCLNISNGNNELLEGLWTNNNPNLYCIEVDDVALIDILSPIFNFSIDAQTSYSENCNYPSDCFTASIGELASSKTLIQILDMMGRETTFKPNTPLIYVYDDGSTKKVFTIE